MQDFQLSIPVLEDTITRLQTSIAEIEELKGRLEETNADLVDCSWAGLSSAEFQTNSDHWASRFGTYLSNMRLFKDTLSKVVLPRAQALDKQAIDLAGILGGAGGGSSEQVSLSWSNKEEMCRHCADLCNAYDAYIQQLQQISILDGNLCYTNFSVGDQIQTAIRAIQDNQDNLRRLKTAMDNYQSDVEELERTMSSQLSDIQMPKGWSSELGEALQLNQQMKDTAVRTFSRKIMNYKGLNLAYIHTLMQRDPADITQTEYLALEYVFEKISGSNGELQTFFNACYLLKTAEKPQKELFSQDTDGAKAYLQAMQAYQDGAVHYIQSPVFQQLAQHYMRNLSLPAVTEACTNIAGGRAVRPEHIAVMRRAGLLHSVLQYGGVSTPSASGAAAYHHQSVTVDGEGQQAVDVSISGTPNGEVQIMQYEFGDWDGIARACGQEEDGAGFASAFSGVQDAASPSEASAKIGLIGESSPGQKLAAAAIGAIGGAAAQGGSERDLKLGDYAYAYGLWGQLNVVDGQPQFQYAAVDQNHLAENLSACQEQIQVDADAGISLEELFHPQSGEALQKINRYVETCRRLRADCTQEAVPTLSFFSPDEKEQLGQIVSERWEKASQI